jgi:uncharacterized protein YhaN
MAKSKASIGSRGVVLKKDIIKTVEQRFEKVKAEKARRIKEWKESLTDLTEDAQNKKDEYIDKIKDLNDEIDSGENPKENQKKIIKLREQIKKLDKDKYTDKDLKQKQREIMQSIMVDLEGKLCPFCGRDFGGEQGVKSHLCEKSDGLNDKELKKMNTVSERSTKYAKNYKKEHGINKFDVEVPLEEFDDKLVKVDISEEIHHLISVDPYASTLRISRIGNLIDFNVNSNPNLISAPAVDAVAFKKTHGVQFSGLSEKDKYKIAEATIEKSKTQVHKGGHGFTPAKGVPSYEKKLVQDMAEIEQEVLEMSESGCLGQTAEGREKVKNLVKTRLQGLQKRIKDDITNFETSADGKEKVERFLAQVDYDYHTGKEL